MKPRPTTFPGKFLIKLLELVVLMISIVAYRSLAVRASFMCRLPVFCDGMHYIAYDSYYGSSFVVHMTFPTQLGSLQAILTFLVHWFVARYTQFKIPPHLPNISFFVHRIYKRKSLLSSLFLQLLIS
jgi:hypothetical protein